MRRRLLDRDYSDWRLLPPLRLAISAPTILEYVEGPLGGLRPVATFEGVEPDMPVAVTFWAPRHDDDRRSEPVAVVVVQPNGLGRCTLHFGAFVNDDRRARELAGLIRSRFGPA